MKTLNAKELAKINELDMSMELCAEKVKSSRLELLVLEEKVKVISYQMKDLREKCEHLKKLESNARQVQRDFLKTIAKKKDLPSGWGFNPDNGEIITGD